MQFIESKVLIINTNLSVCTELARHLVLSGVNVHLISKEAGIKVEKGDNTNDFLLNPQDVGQLVSIFLKLIYFYQKGKVIKEKLQEMNPFCKVEFSENYNSL